MIIRKPYAFIIKHFRLLHLIILVMLLYIYFDLNSIYQLFSSFQKTHTYTYMSAFLYIDNLVNYAIGIAFIMSGIIFWLLKIKKKNINLYLGIFVYLAILIIGYIFLHSRLTAIQNEVFESDQIILVKDISMLLNLPMYVFIPFCFIRGIGFNIKQFNFSKDIAELKIADEDSEEFELLIGQNNYKYFRTARRAFRETKYFILENAFPLSIIGGVLGVILLGSGIYYYNSFLKKLSAAEVTSIDSISYVVNSSYMTAKDYTGDEIRDGYKYVVINMAFHNVSTETKSLNLDLITLADGRIIYYPTLTKNSKFYDLGVPYKEKQQIYGGEMIEATLTFEIPASVRTKNFTLRVQYGMDDTFDRVLVQYKKFDIKTTSIDAEEVTIDKKMNDTINVNVIGKNKIGLTVTNFAIVDLFDNKYVSCSSMERCYAYSSVISTTDVSTKTMLVVDFKANIDNEANILQTFNTTNKIFKNYANIKYTINDVDHVIPATIVSNSDVDSKVFFEVPRNIIRASSVQLCIDFRDELYVYKLV